MENKINSDIPISEKKEFYEQLRKQCLNIKNYQLQIGQDLIKKVYPLIRNYQIDIQGEENIPNDSNVIFVANHSNSHDIFTAYEMFSLLERRGSVMVATDCLSPITTQIFNISNATLLDRRIQEERQDSILRLSNKILNGNDGLIFGESTWNIHPTRIMHNIRNGASKISLITQVPIVPTIIEYLEKDEMVSSDSKLYDKCIIKFGKPVNINYTDSLSYQSNIIKNEMENIRKQIWNDYSVSKVTKNIDPFMYVNHTYVKKFKALGFTYDSLLEQQYLLFLNNELCENEYTINSSGQFVPGITEKSFKMRKLK